MSEISAFPPGPPSRWPGGIDHLVRLARQPLTTFQQLSTYGDLAYFKVRYSHVYYLNSPDLVRDALVTNQRIFARSYSNKWLKHLVGNGLLTSEGDFWLRQRRLMQPAFHRKQIASYSETMTRYSQQTQNEWQDGQIVNANEEMWQLTLSVVGKAMFDTDIAVDDPRLSEALKAMHKWAGRALLPPFLAQRLEKLPLPTTLQKRQAVGYFDELIYRMIRERRASGESRGDLLSMLIEIQDADIAGVEGRMTDRQIHDELITIFLAGHETTALTLTWLWHLLGEHPEVESRLHTELDRVLAGRLPTVEDMPNLPYTEAVVSEALRLYPPAYALSRLLTEEYEMGGYRLPAKSTVLIIPYTIHRNPQVYPDPERFDPERWTPQARIQRPKGAFIPFGMGARQCIGEPFAWMEAILILATLAQQWKMRRPAGKAAPKPHPMITLTPDRPVLMRLERRHPNPVPTPLNPPAETMIL